MRFRLAVNLRNVALESPRQCRLVVKPLGPGQLLVAQAKTLGGRVVPPKAIHAAVVGQPAVDAHPCAGDDEHCVGSVDDIGCVRDNLAQLLIHDEALSCHDSDLFLVDFKTVCVSEKDAVLQ